MSLVLTAFKAENYKPFANTNWIQIRPITLTFGHNSSGKSALLSILPMLKQSIEDPDLQTPFIFASETGVDLGAFEEVSYLHKVSLNNPIRFHLELTASQNDKDKDVRQDIMSRRFYRSLDLLKLNSERIQFEVSANYNKKQRQIAITESSVYVGDKLIFRAYRKTTAENQAWHFEPEELENSDIRMAWHHFVPRLFSFRDRDEKRIEVYSDLSNIVAQSLSQSLRKLVHIGPLRDFPKRAYRLTGESPRDVGQRGENWLNILLRARSRDKLVSEVNRWLDRLGYSLRIDWGKQGFVHPLLKDKNGLEISLKDTGFGISQILPLLIQGFSCAPGTILILEQPEIHLHPKAQAELGDMLIAIASRGVRLIIETHSEHLLLRLQRRIAEESINKDGLISPTDLSIYFIEQKDSGSVIHNVEVSNRGEFIDPPKKLLAFFSDDYIETVKWTNTIAKIASHEGER
jgi:predicted ATPase